MYRFRINPSTDNIEFTPSNRVDLTKTKKRESDGNGSWYYEYSLSDLIIDAKNSPEAYNYLKGLVDAELGSELGSCAEHYLVVERSKNYSWVVTYEGAFSIRDCEVDLNKCYIKFKTEVIDNYRCLLGKTDIDFNILTLPDTITLYGGGALPFNVGFVFTFQQDSGPIVKPFGGAYPNMYFVVDSEAYASYYLGNDYVLYLWGYVWELTDCLNGNPVTPEGTGWINWTQIQTGSPCAANGTTEWRRNFTADPGFLGIAEINGVNASSLAVVQANSLTALNGPAGVQGPPTNMGCNWATSTTVGGEFDNGVSLLDVVTALVQQACPLIEFVQSDFFSLSINPVTGQTNYWKDPALYQITDIKTPNSDQNASRCFVTFDKLMGDLNKMFDVWWRIKDGVFYLEHSSYFSGESPTDLTAIKGFERFTFKKDTLEGSREFVSRAQNNIDFVGRDITYTRPCVNTERKTINLELLCADIDFIRTYPDDAPNDAVVIIARDGSNIIEQNGIISGVLAPNAPMSWANIHPFFHRHNANTLNGTINGDPGEVDETTFIQTVPIRESNITIVDCDFDIDEYKPIQTLLGTGDIDELKIDLKTRVVNIKYSL